MKRWTWLQQDVVIAIHEDQLAEHGGGSGLRDPAMLESALARPKDKAGYGKPDVAELSAAYGYGIARNHPFIDGNKRTAFVAVELFLTLNGYSLDAGDVDCVVTMLAVASGEMPEDEFAVWVRKHAVRQ